MTSCPWRIAAASGLVLLAVAVAATADFAAAPGFSGRVADCSACHRPPLEGDTAKIGLEGLPDAWDAQGRYDLAVRLQGGPVGNPLGPRGGFELEVLRGGFLTDPAEGVRSFYDRQATYTEDGVFQTRWNLSWIAPGLDQQPAPITFWLAGLAANGNHDTHLNASDLGEHGDSVATWSITLAPSDATLDAWRAIPLRPPQVTSITPISGGHRIEGGLGDDNATHLDIHNGRGWQRRAAQDAWRVDVQGDGVVQLRSVGSERLSPIIHIDLGTGDVTDGPPRQRTTPWPAIPVILPILLGLTVWRRP